MGVNNLTYSKNGLHLTELFEGDILTAYRDQRDLWTIGYGHTAGVHPGMSITPEQANEFLADDIRAAATNVNELVTVKLTQAQFDSLVDFVFNLGVSSFRRCALLKEINAGNFAAATAHFRASDHCAGVVNAGLLRRLAENLSPRSASTAAIV